MLKQFLLENWKQMTGSGVPSTLQIVPITSCLNDYGNDLILIFVNKKTYPDYVMKISRCPQFNFKLKNEYSALMLLNSNRDISVYIPSPFFIGTQNKCTFFIQEGFPGTSLSKAIKKNGMTTHIQRMLNKSVEILLAINCVKINDYSETSQCNEKFPDILDQYRSTLIAHGVNSSIIEELKEDCRYFLDLDHNYFLHGDYWHTNIIVNNNDVCGIIDWEFSVSSSRIPTDICWFLINLSTCLQAPRHNSLTVLDAFKWAFFTKGEHSDILLSCSKQYFEGLRLDQNLFNSLLKISLIKMSVRELMYYGKHTNMDFVCIEMLKFFIQNESNMCIY